MTIDDRVDVQSGTLSPGHGDPASTLVRRAAGAGSSAGPRRVRSSAQRGADAVASAGPGEVVVGITGSQYDVVTVVWALQDAARRRVCIRLVHSLAGCAPRYDPQRFYRALRGPVRGSGLVPLLRQTNDPLQAALLKASADALLVVVGQPSRPETRPPGADFLPSHLAARSGCPVVVVPGAPAAAAGGIGKVVAGITAGTSPPRHLAFAFGEAHSSGTGLTVVHAGEDASGAPALARALAGWRAAYPDVPITARVVRGDAEVVLRAAVSPGDLLVLGTRRDGRVPASLGGRVTSGLLRTPPCAVAVVG